jgi:hypothetical protein
VDYSIASDYNALVGFRPHLHRNITRSHPVQARGLERLVAAGDATGVVNTISIPTIGRPDLRFP